MPWGARQAAAMRRRRGWLRGRRPLRCQWVGGEGFVVEGLGLFPPDVPALADEAAGLGWIGGGGCGGEESGGAEEEGVAFNEGAGLELLEGEEVGELAEGGAVLFVAEGGEEFGPEALLGGGLLELGFEALGFEVEAVLTGGLEPGGEGGGGEVGAGVVVGVAEGVGGGVDVFVGVAGVVLEEGLEGNLDEAGDVGAGEVDEVEADVGIVGVVAVAVVVPVGGVNVDFEVAAEAAGGVPMESSALRKSGPASWFQWPGWWSWMGWLSAVRRFLGRWRWSAQRHWMWRSV